MWTDLRHATRALLHSPGFTATAVLTLAIGIGGTAAMFTVVNQVVFQPLPFPHADRLVLLWGSKPHIIRSVDPNQPVSQMETLSGLVNASVAQPRAHSLLLSSFATVALAFAVIGIYGLLAYSVAQRTPELGIRLALGGQPNDVLAMIVSEGFRLVLAGILIGVPAAVAVATTLQSLLFGVAPVDAPTIATAVGLMLTVGIVACYLPARRATRVDPMAALRRE
jgi:putative ABC transport system permease protein